MDRRFISASITVALVFAMMGLTMLAAPIAGAQTAGVRPLVENFMPEDTTATGGDLDKNQLSDGFDGVDSTAHLTAVGDENATQVAWYLCGPPNTGSDPTTPTATNNACELIGEDTSGVTQLQNGTSTDVAFEFNWNIPANRDETNYTVVTRACNSTPTASESNCHYDFNDGVYLDDSSTVGGNAPQLGQNGQSIPTGELMGFCVTPTSGICSSTNSAFVSDGHGQNAPQGAVWVWRTSTDITSSALCIDVGANSGNDPDTCDTTATAVLGNTTTGSSAYKEWTATPNAVAVGDADFGIAGAGSGLRSAAQCTGTAPLASSCMLDEHYKLVVAGSASGTNSTARLTFTTTDATCSNQDSEEFNRMGTTEVVLGCLTDQFGRVLAGQSVQFSTTGSAGFISACGPANTGTGGTTTPTGFGTTSTGCTTTTDSNGQASATAVNTPSAAALAGGQTEGTPGTQTITFCAGSLAAGSSGCTSGAPNDTVTKHWVGLPEHIHLVFAGTGDAADPCHTGDQFKTNEVGDTDDVLACVFNEDDVATSTVMTGESAATWRISFTRSSCTGVTFDGNPPTETDDDGTATVTIRATGDGSCDINANLINNGTTVDTATVNKTVTEQGTTTECNDNVDNDADGDTDFPNDDGCVNLQDNSEDSENPGGGDTTGTACEDRENDPNVIVGTDGADVLQGTPNRDIICGLGGDDVISGRAGNDLIQGNGGSDTVGGGGGKDNVTGNGQRDNVSGNKGNDAVKGGGGGDTLKGNGGIDSITGGKGSDSLQGGDGEDILKGGGGDDTLRGGAGDDALNGGGGTDQCFGNAGNDSVTGCE